MICVDELRGRLAEVFSLKSFKVDHVLHGAIASAAVYGALLGGSSPPLASARSLSTELEAFLLLVCVSTPGASAEQIESAIGMTVAHYVPYRAIRCGQQLSDSKGASAALSAEAAVLCTRRGDHFARDPKP